jgi:hypothetical protein
MGIQSMHFIGMLAFLSRDPAALWRLQDDSVAADRDDHWALHWLSPVARA